MANYAALWTSSRDPEFIQMKKVKQLTERYLAMNMTGMKEEHRRHVKKAQEHIRENQDILDRLEKEKETIARSILARFHRYHRLKDTARQMASKFRQRRQDKQKEEKASGIVQLPTLPVEKQKPAQAQYTTRSKVLMTHTFPFVYHSYGDKPCPRYDMFLESQEFGPQEITSRGYQLATFLRKPAATSRRDTLQKASLENTDTNTTNGNEHKPPGIKMSKTLSTTTGKHTRPLNKIALAVGAIHELKKNNQRKESA